MAFGGWASEYYKNPLKTNEEENVSTKPSSPTSSMSSPKPSSVQRTATPKDPAAQAKLKARQDVLKRKFSTMKSPK